MSCKRFIHLVVSFFLLSIVSAIPVVAALADSGTNNDPIPVTPTPHNGMVDPNYRPSPQDLEFIAQKERSLHEFVFQAKLDEYAQKYEHRYGSMKPNGLTSAPLFSQSVTPRFWSYYRVLPLERKWEEPDDWAHRNYCGPGATQVALDVRLSASAVPDIDTIGIMENIDPSWGVYMSAVKNTLNQILQQHGDIPNNNGFVAYELARPYSEWDLFSYVDWDNQRGYATVSAVYTYGMPGWEVNAYHIVAIFGLQYDSEYDNYYKYAETASPTAGYYGGFSHWAFFGDFYQWYSRNPAITW